MSIFASQSGALANGMLKHACPAEEKCKSVCRRRTKVKRREGREHWPMSRDDLFTSFRVKRTSRVVFTEFEQVC